MKYRYLIGALAAWWLFWTVMAIVRRVRARLSPEPQPADYQVPE
jgi:hypothetical protein